MNDRGNLDAGDGPRAFRWRLRGDANPDFSFALRLGEATRAAMLRAWVASGNRGFSDRFHSGACWLPEDLDGDSKIDHMLLFAADEIPSRLLQIAAAGARIFLTGAGKWRLDPVWMGTDGQGGCFATARQWVSQTPYYTPLDCVRRKGGPKRPNRTLEKQLRDEIERRQLPPIHAAIISEFDSFRTAAASSHRLTFRQHCRVELTLAAPVSGPFTLGYGAHLGLGLFAPHPIPE